MAVRKMDDELKTVLGVFIILWVIPLVAVAIGFANDHPKQVARQEFMRTHQCPAGSVWNGAGTACLVTPIRK